MREGVGVPGTSPLQGAGVHAHSVDTAVRGAVRSGPLTFANLLGLLSCPVPAAHGGVCSYPCRPRHFHASRCSPGPVGRWASWKAPHWCAAPPRRVEGTGTAVLSRAALVGGGAHGRLDVKSISFFSPLLSSSLLFLSPFSAHAFALNRPFGAVSGPLGRQRRTWGEKLPPGRTPTQI